MIVGSDERRYPWMDEGFNTYINRYSNSTTTARVAARRRTGADGIARGMKCELASSRS